MAGIGKYKKETEEEKVKFTLKSGNTPPFKYMGSSPIEQDEIDPIPNPEEGDVVIKEKTEKEKEKDLKTLQEMYDKAIEEQQKREYQGPPIDEL